MRWLTDDVWIRLGIVVLALSIAGCVTPPGGVSAAPPNTAEQQPKAAQNTLVFAGAQLTFPKGWTVRLQGGRAAILLPPQKGALIEVFRVSKILQANSQTITRLLQSRRDTTEVKVTQAVAVEQNGLPGTSAEGTARIKDAPVRFKLIALPIESHAVLAVSFVGEQEVGRFERDLDAVLGSLAASTTAAQSQTPPTLEPLITAGGSAPASNLLDEEWKKQMTAGSQAYEKGDYAAAERYFAAALKRAEQFGENDPRFATSLNNLAAAYKEQGRSAEAEPLHRRALAIREKVLGPQHPEVADSLYNLANLYRTQGRSGEAEPLSRRALAIREKVLGPQHPAVALSLNNLAVLYYRPGPLWRG